VGSLPRPKSTGSGWLSQGDTHFTANQTNAQSSTGPRTDEGKAASSQNSACHGLASEFAVLSHENSAEFNELSTQSIQEFQPSGIHEEFLVRRMIEARWRAARCQRLEHAAFESMLNPDPDAANLSPDARPKSWFTRGSERLSSEPLSECPTIQPDTRIACRL
jgi:hypothetical protein